MICPKCNIDRKISEYHNNIVKIKHCKPCERVRQRNYRKANPELIKKFKKTDIARHSQSTQKNYDLRKMYGITLNDYDNLLKIQEFKCAICKTDKIPPSGRKLHVDHDHETGRVRGLLCHSCNTGIGSLKDSQEILLIAYNYLNIKFEPNVSVALLY